MGKLIGSKISKISNPSLLPLLHPKIWTIKFCQFIDYDYNGRLASTSKCFDSSDGDSPQFICRHHKRQLGWRVTVSMPCHCVLFAARTHPGWWVHKFFHKSQWSIKHNWNSPFVCLSRLALVLDVL